MQKTLTARVLILSLGSMLQKGSTLLVIMFLVRLLDQASYGTYQQVLYIGGIAYGLFASGMSAGIYYFLPRLEGEQRSRFVVQTIGVMAALGAGSAIVVFLAAPEIAAELKNPLLEPMLRYYSAYIFFWIGVDYFVPFLNASERHGMAVSFGVVEALTNAAFLILPLWKSIALPEALGILSLAAGIRYVVYIIVTLRLTNGHLRKHRANMVGEHFKYSLPLMASGWADLLGGYLDKVVISLLYKPATVAIYAIGTIYIPIWEIVAKPVNIVLRVKFAELLGDDRSTEISPIWREAVRKQSMVVLPVVFLLWAVADHVIRLFFTNAYADSILILRISLLDKPLFIMSFSVFPLSMGRSDVLFKGSFVFLAANALLLLAISTPLGYFGPVTARVLAQYATIAYYVYIIVRQLHIPATVLFPVNTLMKVFASNFVAGLIAFGLGQVINSHVAAITAASVAFSIVYVVLLKFLGVLRTDDIDAGLRLVTFGKIHRKKGSSAP